MVKRRGMAALALGMALVLTAVGCAEDDDFLIGGKRPATQKTPKPTASGGTGGTGGGSDVGGGIGTGDKPVATPTPAPTPTPTPSPTPPPPGTIVHSYVLQFDSPDGIAFDSAGNAWVACYGDGVMTSVATKIDPDGQLLLEPPAGIGPRQVAVDAQGNAWFANSTSNTVTRIAADGSDITSIAVGSGPRALAITPDGKSLWVALGQSPALVALDLTTHATQSVAPVAATGIAFHGDKAWVAYAASSSIGVYSMSGAFERELTLGSNPSLVRASSDAVWVLTVNGVTRIDPQTDEKRSISMGNSLDLALDAEGGAWISQSSPALVKRYQPNGDFAANFTIGLAPQGLAFHPTTGYLWVTDRTGKKVNVLVP